MEASVKKNWWQGSWPIPLSVVLHVLVVAAFYLQWPGGIEAPAEPESVSVELVEPPKEEPPKPEEKKPEEKQAEEPPPPSPPPPAQSHVVQPPTVAVRPGPTQLDERDEPGKQEAGGEKQPEAEEQADSTQQAATAKEQPSDSQQQPDASSLQATSDEGELLASRQPGEADVATVPVPTPQPAKREPQIAKSQPDGADDPKLKPAKKILAAGKRPGPMLRQIMGNLPPRERVGQLCVAEAMAQIKDARGFYDGLEPHTGKNYPIEGNVMIAKGAFNVGTQWYPIDYRCDVDIDNYMVTAFHFNIGPKLTPEDVKRLNLIVR